MWLWSKRYGEMSPKCEFWRNEYWTFRQTGKSNEYWDKVEKEVDFDYCEEYVRSISNETLLCLKESNLANSQLSFADW